MSHIHEHTHVHTHTHLYKRGGGFTQRGGEGETCNSSEFEVIFKEKLKVTK
jgi:hypothetical protein